MTSKADYAWAAGIVDGEGCLYIGRHRAGRGGCKADSYFLALKVAMGHEPTILRLRSIFGSGSKHRMDQQGCNPAYIWIVQARLLEQALDKLEPFIFTKAEEVKVAREFLALPGWHGGNHRGPKSLEYQKLEYDLWDRMRRLKPRTKFKLEEPKLHSFHKSTATVAELMIEYVRRHPTKGPFTTKDVVDGIQVTFGRKVTHPAIATTQNRHPELFKTRRKRGEVAVRKHFIQRR